MVRDAHDSLRRLREHAVSSHHPLPRLVPWLLAVPAPLLIGYLHELMHDGRHLLGVPRH
ncbi:hypothetical protein E1284_10815 [Actinomadura bangladeshensis]|uniref:Uncharacterized protein n=1 Tax=Actinomadura bangladeshensis TaxID=453573 RepID=A0A4R4P7V7_9ACTN|nr:hypothetical protein E1284_10815 [Actinomadura bangladeshensis]